MKVKTLIALLFWITISSCHKKYAETTDGILVENIAEVINGTEFTTDNKIHQGGSEFVYDYSFFKDGENYHFKSLNDFDNLRDGWVLIKQGDRDSTTITNIKMVVLENQGRFSRKQPDYKESVVEYQYLTRAGIPYFKTLTKFAEQTGLVENKKNIWIHPPRSYLFKIMELNPWPYVKYPLKKSATWNWELVIGDKWQDERWKTWSGQITNKCTYQVEGKEWISTSLGKMECIKITSSGISRIGNTYLTSYFNEELGGFVKLIYTNIDGSLLSMELKDLIQKRG